MNWRQIGAACVAPNTSIEPALVVSAVPSVVPSQTATASRSV
jgi:hypothetical protein